MDVKMELLEKYKDDYGVITVNKRHFKLIEDMNHFEVYDNLVYNIPSSGCFKDGVFIDDTQEKAEKQENKEEKKTFKI